MKVGENRRACGGGGGVKHPQILIQTRIEKTKEPYTKVCTKINWYPQKISMYVCISANDGRAVSFFCGGGYFQNKNNEFLEWF